MLDRINDLILTITDAALGWLLAISPDLALLVISIGTAAIMVLVRPFTTSQAMLRRASNDKKRLKTLFRLARQRKDKPALARHRLTKGQIALKQLRAEGLPFLVGIIPVILLGVWGFQRLAFITPADGEPFELRAYAPVSSAGQFMHIVPADTVRTPHWIAPIDAVTELDTPEGRASWTISARASTDPHTLTLRFNDKTIHRQIRVGHGAYAQPLVQHDPEFRTELGMRQYRPFGVVPAITWQWMPMDPWMLAYLIIAVPLVFAFKWLTGIY